MPGVNDWMAKASGDLKSAKKLIKDDDETLDASVYFTQQVAEKALKAYLIFKQQPILRTHDLVKLLKDCMVYDASFEQLQGCAKMLLPFATYSRYPDDRFHIDRQEALEAVRCAESILKFVKDKVAVHQKDPQLKIFEGGLERK